MGSAIPVEARPQPLDACPPGLESETAPETERGDTDSVSGVMPAQRTDPPSVLFEALRPRQWVKNLLVFGGLLFTLNGRNFHPAWAALAAFACFCALSSAVYLLNDILDRERDLAHPRKRRRPIASGRLSPGLAAGAAVLLAVLGAGGAFAIRVPFGLLSVGYLLLNLSYTLWLKHEVIIDVLCLAAGFILRALAGAVALAVTISPWLLVCTALLSLVLGFGKRRQELVMLESAATHRKVLLEYSAPFLDQLITSMAAATVVSYLFYSFQSDTARHHPGIAATIPFVLYGIFRYLYLVHERALGGAPEDLLFKDRRLLLAVLGFGITAVAVMLL